MNATKITPLKNLNKAQEIIKKQITINRFGEDWISMPFAVSLSFMQSA
jgi:hypothetical protein